MTSLEILFWGCLVCVIFPYFFYPLVIFLMACFHRPIVRPDWRFAGSISIVLAVHNEENGIDRKLNELKNLIAVIECEKEIIVVSDGSTDNTALLAKRHTESNIRVIELPVNIGKGAALTRGCAEARGDVIVFADVRQQWAIDALEKLLRPFSDPEVGATSGNLILESEPGLLSGVGFYWRYEKWLRRLESNVHSVVSVTGAISAVRRSLFRPIPRGTILDDIYWPLQVVMQGYRVVHEDSAHAFDQLPMRPKDEFRRKVRTLSGNFQLLTQLPAALLPWRNPIWIEFVSHKIMRLFVPWALLGVLFASAMLSGPIYQAAFLAQLIFYFLGVIGIVQGARTQLRLTSAVGSFLVLNSAALLAFWVWISGKVENSWGKAQYSRGGEEDL